MSRERKFYTIMIVPHAADKFRRVRVSRNLVIGGAAAIVVLLFSGILLPHFVIRSTYLSWMTSRLARQNAELKQANQEIDVALGDLRYRLSEFENKASQLASMIGVQNLPVTHQAAAGGGLSLDSLSPMEGARFVKEEIDLLKDRSETLQNSMKILDAAYEKQAIILASTPSILPVKGLFGNGYGWRRDPFTEGRDFHGGLDVVAPPGSRVVAPADGVVTQAGPTDTGFGNFIAISHGYGVVTHYGHLQRFAVRAGQQVHRGDVIGYVGTTGRSTGPHLHYEVVVHQRTVDPTQYVLDDFRNF